MTQAQEFGVVAGNAVGDAIGDALRCGAADGGGELAAGDCSTENAAVATRVGFELLDLFAGDAIGGGAGALGPELDFSC